MSSSPASRARRQIVWTTGLLMMCFASVSVSAAGPQRVVSLNLCADALLMELVEPKRIASLTRLSLDPSLGIFYERMQALEDAGMHFNSGLAEEIIALEPDLVVTVGDAAPYASQLLERLGLPVVKLEAGERIASYLRNLDRLARALGEADEAERLRAGWNARVARLRAQEVGVQPSAMVLQASGFTAGSETLINDVLMLAGMRNLAAEQGLQGNGFMTLEEFVAAAPQVLIVSAERPRWPSLAHASMEHAAVSADAAGASQQRIVVNEREWTCGSSALLSVAERLAAARSTVLAVEQ